MNAHCNADPCGIAKDQPSIIRTERGLTISGTRLTLYDVMDYLKANYPPKFIRDTFNLTDSQLSAVLSYIEEHEQQVEAEYQEILDNATEIREYWQAYNRERLAKLSSDPPSKGYEKVRTRLAERRKQREIQQR